MLLFSNSASLYFVSPGQTQVYLGEEKLGSKLPQLSQPPLVSAVFRDWFFAHP